MAASEKSVQETKQTYENIAQKYAKNTSSPTILSEHRKKFVALLPARGKVLDVGCGGGRDTRAFLADGLEVTANDYSENMLAIARKEAPAATFLKGDMRDLALQDGYYDGIWSSATLHHVSKEDASKLLVKFYNAIKEGGVLFVDVAFGKGDEMVDLEGGKRLFCHYEKAELGSMLKKAGFEIRESHIETAAGSLGASTSFVVAWAKKAKEYYVFTEGRFEKTKINSAFFETHLILWSARLSTGLFGLTSCPSGNEGPKSANEVILGVGDEGLAKLAELGFIPCPVCHPESSPYFSWSAISGTVSALYNLHDTAEYADKKRVPFDSRRLEWHEIVGTIHGAPSRIYLPEGLSPRDIESFRSSVHKIIRDDGNVAKEPVLGYYDRKLKAKGVEDLFVEYPRRSE